MATANRNVLINMQSKLMAMGGVRVAVIGEPKSKMQDGTVAIIPESVRIDETTLQSPRELHTVVLKRYEDAMREPTEDIEFDMDAWRADIFEDLAGDFDLGGTIAYLVPTETVCLYRFQLVENFWFRTGEITIVYRIDDNAAFVK